MAPPTVDFSSALALARAAGVKPALAAQLLIAASDGINGGLAAAQEPTE